MDAIFTPWLIWFVLGIVLAFLELLLPGFIVLFFGIGCWVASAATLIWGLSPTQQILVFIVASITSLVFLRRLLMRTFRGSAKDSAVGFDDFPAGLRVKVIKPITADIDQGRIHYRGTPWGAIADEEIEEGATVEIVRFADSSRQVFFVKRIQAKE